MTYININLFKKNNILKSIRDDSFPVSVVHFEVSDPDFDWSRVVVDYVYKHRVT